MPTAAESFDTTIARVRGLLVAHTELHGIRGRPPQRVGDVLRGALVLGVGALDALVLDSLIASIPEAAWTGRLGRNVSKWVKESPDRFLAVLGEADPTEAIAVLCREKLEVLTFQRANMIEGVLRDTVNRPPPWSRAAEILSIDGEAWDADDVKAKLDEIVERRHRIAHSADVLPGSTKTRPIRRPYVEEAIRVIEAVGRSVTEVLA